MIKGLRENQNTEKVTSDHLHSVNWPNNRIDLLNSKGVFDW